jgi:hypothetical protein
MCVIANLISRDLRSPVSLIALRAGAADATAVTVPIAAMHEYDFVAAGKDKIWLARQISAVQTETEAKLMRDTANDNFRLGMSRTDTRHIRRAPFRRNPRR